MKKVEVWLYKTSEPLVHSARSTYTKGFFYCVYNEDRTVTKYPERHIFRVIEGYGTRGGEMAKEEVCHRADPNYLGQCNCSACRAIRGFGTRSDK